MEGNNSAYRKPGLTNLILHLPRFRWGTGTQEIHSEVSGNGDLREIRVNRSSLGVHVDQRSSLNRWFTEMAKNVRWHTETRGEAGKLRRQLSGLKPRKLSGSRKGVSKLALDEDTIQLCIASLRRRITSRRYFGSSRSSSTLVNNSEMVLDRTATRNVKQVSAECLSTKGAGYQQQEYRRLPQFKQCGHLNIAFRNVHRLHQPLFIRG